MAESRGSGGKKQAAPVEVIYFPKRGCPSQDPAVPEGSRGPRGEPGRESAPRPERKRRSAARATSPARPGRSPQRRAPPAREAPSPPLTRKQLAEMSLFGHHLFERGQLEEARAVFEKIVGMGVEESFPHTMLGTIYLASGDPDRALALFEAALTLDEADLAARVYRAEIRLSAGKVEEAARDLDQAIGQGLAGDPFVDRAQRLLERVREQGRRSRR